MWNSENETLLLAGCFMKKLTETYRTEAVRRQRSEQKSWPVTPYSLQPSWNRHTSVSLLEKRSENGAKRQLWPAEGDLPRRWWPDPPTLTLHLGLSRLAANPMTRDTTGDGLLVRLLSQALTHKSGQKKKKKKECIHFSNNKKNVVAITSQDFHLHFTADLN